MSSDRSTTTHHTVTIPQSVHARFSLSEDTRVMCYQPSEDDKRGYKRVQGARVRLSAVHGEPFGAHTPNGSIEMTIANPVAAAMFVQAELGQEFDVIICPFTPVVEQEEPQPRRVK